MNRRKFLKTSGMSVVCLYTCTPRRDSAYLRPTNKRFAHLEINGNYRDIGYETGRVFKKNINGIIKRRAGWHKGLMETLRSKKALKYSDKLLALAKRHFPKIIQEMEGIADGAGIHFDSLWAMNIKSELGVIRSEPPGCSSIFVHNDKDMWLFHNEDGHTAYQNSMFTIKASPPSGISYIAMVYPGIITGNGPSVNSRGIVQTTNYIGSVKSEIGIPRYIIGRAILEAKDLEEAIQIATFEPRTYPYHHNIISLSEKKYASVETIPNISEIQYPGGLYCHTNHLLFDNTGQFQNEDQEYKNSSSISRYTVIHERLESLDKNEVQQDDIFSILSSHESKPYSPCRHPEEDVFGQTLGTAYIDVNSGEFRLYKGNPCESVAKERFVHLNF